MQKHEVLNLLERFPELVDSDDLLDELFQQATNDAPADDWKSAKPAKSPAKTSVVEESLDTYRGRAR